MAESIHPAAASGYQTSTDAYERGRPEYPDAAIQFLVGQLGILHGATVLDLGAGTGKFTKTLLPTGARLIAVEPVEAMRQKAGAALAGVEIVEGNAESIPLAPGACDVVVAAQAFHWFDGPRALREIHRVLKAGGRLGLIWNVRDESVDWVARLTEIADPHERGTPGYRSGDWRKAFTATDLFGPLQEREFRHVQSGPPSMVEDRVASISFIAALPTAARSRVLEEVRTLVANHPATRGRSTIEIPYRTDVFVCDRRKA